ncbi:hypothetical protein GCM10007854_06030 [Algimonas porphyrae]|uniref:Uncharacterized protein n=1 Tax=Algimonas porphyrae TaxID=1128113 RepID=A0ABQ5UWX3_9PROT|nr:hypothetical protein GCM10007854_06030 [Algimonas porphyrae]
MRLRMRALVLKQDPNPWCKPWLSPHPGLSNMFRNQHPPKRQIRRKPTPSLR